MTETMKKKNKWIIQLSDEVEEEEKSKEKNMNNMDYDLRVNKVKNEVKNSDGFLAGTGNCRSRFLPMLYWIGIKEVKAVVNNYPCNDNMTKKLTVSSFNWAER